MVYANLTQAVTNITNTSSIVGLTQGINNYMSGGIGISIWAMLVIVVFASLKNRGFYTGDAFMSSIFFGFIIALLLKGMSLIPDWFFFANLVLLGLAGVVAVLNKS